MDDHSTEPDGPADKPDLEATGPMDMSALDDDLTQPSDAATVARRPDDAPTVARRPADPADPDATVTAAPDPGATVPVDPAATVVVNPADTVVRPADPDATQVVAPVDADATHIVPAVPARPAPDRTAVQQAVPDGWSGKAQVRPGPPGDDVPEWTPVSQGRAWWLPILLGVVGLVFIIGIAFALVVAMRGNTVTPVISPSPTPTTPATSSTAPVVIPPSTSSSPSASQSSPSDTALVPDLGGTTLTDAESLLQSLGLTYTLTAQVDDSRTPNTVISTNPGPGPVPVGSSVEIVYAVSSTPSPAPSDSSPSPVPSGSASS